MTILTAMPGDTVAAVAIRAGVDPALLAEQNGLAPQTPLVPGQTLVSRRPVQVYTVQPGDTLYGIAQRYSTSVTQLYRDNPGLGGLPAVSPGRVLVIRYGDEPASAIDANAYAYPAISGGLLRRTLPYLTYLTPFTYGFTPAGTLVPLDDDLLVELALGYGVTPWMHLSTLTQDGTFSSALGQQLLQDPAAQTRLIDAVLHNMREKNYQGLDVDFEFLGRDAAQAYAAFVARLRAALSPQGYEVTVALAPKTADGQPGTLYEGHDYAALGAAADAVLLMTYEWGYTYGPPMAVAPVPSVRRVLDYAVGRIDPKKIFMGIPTYGYDWPLPYERGTTRATSLSNVQAVDLARSAGAAILYDETAEAPYFFYTAPDGTAHEVWFEDARSIAAKLALVQEYGFRGVGYWNLDRPFPQNWTVLDGSFRIAY